MTSSIEAVRAALASGLTPTPGPWRWERIDPEDHSWTASEIWSGANNYEGEMVATHVCNDVDAAYIAACNPVAIADLLAAYDAAIRERDELRGDAERYRAIRREMHADDPHLMVVQDYFGDCGIFPAEELDAEVDALITAQNETAADDAARSTGGDGGLG